MNEKHRRVLVNHHLLETVRRLMPNAHGQTWLTTRESLIAFQRALPELSDRSCKTLRAGRMRSLFETREDPRNHNACLWRLSSNGRNALGDEQPRASFENTEALDILSELELDAPTMPADEPRAMVLLPLPNLQLSRNERQFIADVERLRWLGSFDIIPAMLVRQVANKYFPRRGATEEGLARLVTGGIYRQTAEGYQPIPLRLPRLNELPQGREEEPYTDAALKRMLAVFRMR